ncbi:hypothetical protein PpBr36_01410 [Pyricularia pennisetigena]|uniref:hypothetical protein n=1 Tax=Pyricularia pennisetigena TaxID=1578925 RepID=UPI00114E38D9|nr:hypothetical protein PpBr36_01410 [Pyricularia pennisetigena]TLS28821.1 hypothetical protein PpBr36_01410 [Pyricularia pennisetigena]
MTTAQGDIQPTPRRRRRPAVSCTLCRQRKVRCSRGTPCTNCIRSRTGNCVYDNDCTPQAKDDLTNAPFMQLPLSPPTPLQQSISAPATLVSATDHHETLPLPTFGSVRSLTPGGSDYHNTGSSPSKDLASLQSQIKQLQEQVAQLSSKNQNTINSTTPQASVAGDEHKQPSKSKKLSWKLFGTFHFISDAQGHHNVMSGSRLYGESHAFALITHFSDMLPLNEFTFGRIEEQSSFISTLKRCKDLARVIKKSRAPKWPSLPTFDLPSKQVCDELLDCYLRTSESIYRVVHIPSFKKQYDALWTSGPVRPNPVDIDVVDANTRLKRPKSTITAFFVLLKLALAIGAAVYDERFSFRTAAVRWMYEAESWLSEPNVKPKLGIQSLQIHILLLLARDVVRLGGDTVWLSAGELLRSAIFLGLNRDPAHLPVGRRALAAEMRRRLWSTVLEITVNSAMAAGGPPLVSLEDFDTVPPGNFDDQQLEFAPAGLDVYPEPVESWTTTSLSIALRQTFPARLAVVAFLNGFRSHRSYENTLSLDKQLRMSLRELQQTVSSLLQSGCDTKQAKYAIQTIEFVTHRFLIALHMPFLAPSLKDRTQFTYSRHVLVESALRICQVAEPATGREGDNFIRSCTTGSISNRMAILQASLVIIMEIHVQVKENLNVDGRATLRTDIATVPRASKDWALRCIECGETNIKGFCFLSSLAAYTEALVERPEMDGDEIAEVFCKTMEESAEACLVILQRKSDWLMSSATGSPEELDAIGHPNLPVPDLSTHSRSGPSSIGDLDFFDFDALLTMPNINTTDSMNWWFEG